MKSSNTFRNRARDRAALWVGALVVVVAVASTVLGMRALSVMMMDRTRGDEPRTVVVDSGMSVREVSAVLVQADVLSAPRLFEWYGRLSGRARRIQAGSFTILPGTSVVGLYNILASGSAVEQEVTVPEGWTLADLRTHLAARGFGLDDDVQWQAATWSAEFPFLSDVPDGLDLEGFLFPETYRFLNSATTEDVIRRLLREFDDRVVRGQQDALTVSSYTLFEIVTMASILEREVRDPAAMAQVADIMRKRLEIGMPLQMDSTVNYVTGKNHPGILLSDRDVDSPYNTYLHPGLPVGPISNPGDAAIHAALHPTENPYYYFLTTPEGEVIYARTHEEHVQNKVRYLR